MAETIGLDERALVGLARAGDATAFAGLFAAYHGPLTNYLYRLVRDRDAADDLVQDTFLRAYRALGRTDADLPFRPWLYRIATNLARNHHRHQLVLRWLPFGAVAGRAATDARLAERLGEHDQVVRALRQIGPTFASALLLHHQQGLSLTETAAALGLTTNGAKSRLFRARKAFMIRQALASSPRSPVPRAQGVHRGICRPGARVGRRIMHGETMTCARAQQQLSDQLTSPAESSAARAALDAHLRECVACARFNRQLHDAAASIRALPVVPPNPRVREVVRRWGAAPQQGGLHTMLHRLQQGTTVVVTSLLLAVVSVLALVLLRPGAGIPQPNAAAPAVPMNGDAGISGAAPHAAAVTSSPTVDPMSDGWAALRQRPLALAALAPGASCPRTEGKRVSRAFSTALGAGPAYTTGLGPDGVYGYRQFGDDVPGYVMQFWLSDPSYQGPLLIRGRQLDGSNALNFAVYPGKALPELTLGPGGETAVTVSDAPGWRYWQVYTIAPAPGCYAYQVDGEGFSKTITFQVLPGRPADLLPLPPFGSLPRQLNVTSAVPLDRDRIRVALSGANYLVLRLDVSPPEATPPALDGLAVQRMGSSAGPVVWRTDPGSGGVLEAIWDDGRHRYHLTALDGDAGAWSGDDLLAIVNAFAGAR